MLNKKYIVTVLIMTVGIISWISYTNLEIRAARRDLASSAIRFHVLANSDSTKDQQLKMKVKENVVDYIYQKTSNFDSVEQTRIFLTENDKDIRDIAQQTRFLRI